MMERADWFPWLFIAQYSFSTGHTGDVKILLNAKMISAGHRYSCMTIKQAKLIYMHSYDFQSMIVQKRIGCL